MGEIDIEWPGKGADVNQRVIWVSWKLRDEEVWQKSYQFMERVEDSLNKAVLAVADALSYIIGQVGAYQCKGGGSLERVENKIKSYVVLYAFMTLSYWIGLYASMYAIQAPLLAKLKSI